MTELYATAAPEAQPRISFQQKEALMCYLLRSRGVFLESLRALTPEMFSGSYELGYAVLYRCLVDYDKAYHQMPSQMQMEADFDARAAAHPDELTPEMRRDVFGLLEWAYLIPIGDLPEPYGLDLLRAFTRERLVSDYMRDYWRRLGDFNPADLPTMLRDVTRRHDMVAGIARTQQTGMFIDEAGEPERRISSTGFPYIDEVMNGGRAAREVYVLYGATGSGKCLGKGTPVMMFDGRIKPVEEISAGDLLMGPDSRSRRVLGTTTGREALYRVTPCKGDSYVVNESHILSLRKSHVSNHPLSAGRIVNICVRDFLNKTRYFRGIHKGWRVAVDFPAAPVPLDPYFLGVWLGDGHKDETRVTTPEPEVVTYLTACATEYGLSLKKVDECGKATTYGLTGSVAERRPGSNQIRNLLRDIGVWKNKHIPHIYLANSREVRLELLAGILDTDGYTHNGGHDIVSAIELFADHILYLARSLGLAAYKHEKIVDGEVYYRLSISGDFSEIPFRVPRRVPRERRQIKDVLLTGITVRPIGEGDYYGFELDGDGLFLLGDFTVTHNTTLTAMLSGKAVDQDIYEATLERRRPRAVGVFTYETEPYDYRRIVVSNMARIGVDRLAGKSDTWINTLSSTTLGRPLQEYEGLAEIHAGWSGLPRGELERLAEIRPRLANWHCWNMNDPADPAAGRGYIEEIRAKLDRHRRETGSEFCFVVVDFMQAVVNRYVESKSLRDPEGETRRLLSSFVYRVGAEIARPFNCAVLVTAQLNGEALRFSPTRRVTPADCLGCKTTHINADYTLQLGNPDHRERAVVMWSGKPRRSRGPERDHIVLRQRQSFRDLFPAELALDGSALVSTDPTVMAQQPRVRHERGGPRYIDISSGTL